MSEFTQAELDIAGKYMTDRNWRLSHLYHILDKDGNTIRFVPNTIQQKISEKRWYRNIILKNRQAGITTNFMIDYTDRLMYNENLKIGVIAHKKEEATKIIEKIMFAYNHLPEDMPRPVEIKTKNKGEITFTNGSSIYSSTSYRSGTLQILHITEMGYICAKTPDKAEEIVSGALNSLSPNCIVNVESTAMGRTGWFAETIDSARKRQQMKLPLTKLSYYYQFYPWMDDTTCVLSPSGVITYPRHIDYFKKIEAETKRIITPEQRAFWIMKEEEQGPKIKENFPSTADEAFEKVLEGVIYANELMQARVDKRVTKVPYQIGIPVDTAWDLGMNDKTAVWFCQTVGREQHIIDYYEAKDCDFPHFHEVLIKKGYKYGTHILPHDVMARRQGTGNMTLTRLENFIELFGKNVAVCPNNPPSKADGINTTRRFINTCWFDLENCEDGLEALDNYTKIWNNKLGTYMDEPLHNWAADGADAFRYLAVQKTIWQQRGSDKRNKTLNNPLIGQPRKKWGPAYT